MMGQYRKKPIVINAIQYQREDNIMQVQDFFRETQDSTLFFYNPAENEYFINTLEGNMLVSKGDWVIRGIKNEYYPCKPDIFEATYEAVA